MTDLGNKQLSAISPWSFTRKSACTIGIGLASYQLDSHICRLIIAGTPFLISHREKCSCFLIQTWT